MATPRVEVKRVEPIPGFSTVVGSALASLLVELKSQGRPELAQDFIEFVSNPIHDLKLQVDSLWNFTNIKNIYERDNYFKYGDTFEQQLNNAIAKELGCLDGERYLSGEQRPAYFERRAKIFPAFRALKGMLITANLAKNVNFAEMGKDYTIWSDRLDLSYYFDEVAKCLIPNSAGTTLAPQAQSIMREVARKTAKSMGEILPDKDTSGDYKTIKQNLSGI